MSALLFFRYRIKDVIFGMEKNKMELRLECARKIVVHFPKLKAAFQIQCKILQVR